MRPWERIAAFALSNGAKVLPTSDKKLLTAPFNYFLGLNWRKKLVFIDQDFLHDAEVVGGLIHELGHVLGTKKNLDHGDESEFLGWEWQVAKTTRCIRHWYVNMGNYGTTDGEFGGLSTKGKVLVLRDAYKQGLENGSINKDGSPRCVR